MDQLRQIEAFVAVVQGGSFVKAADKLATSKAVLSRLVMELEAQLDTRLLNRTTRRQSLTEAGADYFERCRKILDDLAGPTWPLAPAPHAPWGACASTRR